MKATSPRVVGIGVLLLSSAVAAANPKLPTHAGLKMTTRATIQAMRSEIRSRRSRRERKMMRT
jgi:hypothetical protein